MKKRILSVLLCLCMVMALLPTTALAEGEGSTSISTFEELKNAFSRGGDYTLAADITVTEPLTLNSEKTLTIHGNEKTIQPAVTGLNEQGLVNGDDATAINNIINNNGSLTLKSLTIYGGKGRCIYNSGTLTMTGVSLERAHLTSGYGAGLHNTSSANALLTNCNIRRNGCDNAGGGFYNEGTLILENCAIVENRNFGSSKGGGAGENNGVSDTATLYMNNCTVANNQSTEIGGGLNNYGSNAYAYIMNSTFTGNVTTAGHARYGGGIGNNKGTVYAVNSAFAFNYASGAASDIGIYDSSSTNVNLYNCAYGAIVASSDTAESTTRTTCKKLTTGNRTESVSALFNGARTSGIVNENGEEQSTTFARPVITPVGSTYGVYPATTSELRSGGTTTYYDRDGFTVKMSYVNSSSTKTALGSLENATNTVKGPDGNARDTNLIGALPANISITTMYTVKVNPAIGGTVTGGSAQGNSYPEGTTDIQITAVPSTGYTFSGWKVGPSNTIDSTNPYEIASLTADVTLTPVFAVMPYSISLKAGGNPLTSHIFPAATVGYAIAPDVLTVTVTNTGNQPTGDLTVELSGDDDDSFTLSAYSINSIAVSGTPATFTVQPKTGLAAGTYTATVTVKGGEGSSITPQTFNVSFTVNPLGTLETVTFGYAYDAQRDPPYPTSGADITFSGLIAPFGPNGSNSGQTNAGSWTLTRAGTYFYLDNTSTISNALKNLANTIADQYSAPGATDAEKTAFKNSLVIHELKNRDDHYAYGVVVAYNANSGYAAFIGDSLPGSAGYLLSVNALTGSVTTKADMVATDFEPSLSIALSQTEAYTFPAATAGYGEQTALEVTVTNTGNAATGTLAVTLTGDNASCFTLGDVDSDFTNGIETENGTDTFTVKPITGLTTGTYTATVTVSGANIASKFFDVTFTVSSSSSSSSSNSTPPSYKVDTQLPEDADGTLSADRTTAKSGDMVTITVTPDPYYKVAGIIIKDQNGNVLDVTDNGDNTFTFKMSAGKVTVEPIFSWDNPFVDVEEDTYYTAAVEWAVKNDVTSGTSETTFSPDDTCTRAQMVTFLWNALQKPEPAYGNIPFTDVPADAYYAKAVQWAAGPGITIGTSADTFSPDAPCTRAQMVTFLWNAAGKPEPESTRMLFIDVPADAYYAKAVQWAVELGITAGTSANTFSPDAPCTRAQMVTFLWR